MDELSFPIDGYRLRAAGDDDAAFVNECMRESILMSVPDNERRLSDIWMDDTLSVVSIAMDGGMMRSETMILDNGNMERIGILWMGISKDQFTCEETGYVLGLFVAEGSRGMGLGRALIGCAEDWCRMKHLLSMTLNVGSPNTLAKDLYNRLGFEERSTVMRKRIR